jgi:hypothetical protein
MSAKVIRCQRCRKRFRGHGNWNAVSIAGLTAGYLCPDCQTTAEDLEAELNLITGYTRSFNRTLIPPGENASHDAHTDYLTKLINSLVNTYKTPEVLRHKADQLAAWRKDAEATNMVGLMLNVADDWESGELWEDSVND